MRNRKKYSRAARLGLISLLLSAALVGTTCAPTTPARATIVRMAPTAEQPSARPAVSEARRLADAANAQGALTADQVSRTGRGLKETQREMQRLVTEANRLRQQKTAGEGDLLELYNRLVEQEKRMSILVVTADEAEASLAASRKLHQQSSVKLSEAEALIVAKDTEASRLREQVSYLNDVAEAQRKIADDNAALAVKESARADKLAGESSFKTKLLLGLGATLLVSFAVIYLLVRPKIPL